MTRTPSENRPDLTITQKASLTSGSSTWRTVGIDGVVPELMLTDGPHGLRKQPEGGDNLGIGSSVPATCFPPAVGLGSSWNPQLARRVGVALGYEARVQDVNVILGPGINIKRSPLCGRNFEYVSEDPLVSARIGAALVTGIQSQGVGATPKHFAVNNQETDRMRVDAQVDERALREIYLPAFEHVVREAKPWALMCSYNKINGVYASQDPRLLTTLLRDEWGFDGLVMSDWGAVNDRVAAVAAGLDLEMPPSQTDDVVTQAVADGSLDEAVLDLVTDRLRLLAERTTGHPEVEDFDVAEHHALAREAAGESIVLLKNDDALFPLDPNAGLRIAVIGEFARTPRFQGGGSSRVVPTMMSSALDELRSAAGERTQLDFAPGFRFDDSESAQLHDEALALASGADVVLLFLGLPESAESEGFDRETLALPQAQLDLLARLAQQDSKVAVILSNGATVDLSGAQEHAAVILETWLLGQAGGAATADVVFGKVAPSGRLTETVPLQLADTPAHLNFPGSNGVVVYGESVFVGYRFYDTANVPVAFPFGFGLTYTTFDYSDLTLVPDSHNAWTAEFTVTNTGDRAGAEVAQMYLAVTEETPTRAAHELRGFSKVFLDAGESTRVSLPIVERDLAIWDTREHRWSVQPGSFTVEVGASSRDIRLTATLQTAGDGYVPPLTSMSTIGEWGQHPFGSHVIDSLKANLPTGLAQSAPELVAMFNQMPLIKLSTWGLGLDGPAIEGLVEQVEAARRAHLEDGNRSPALN